LSSRAASPRVLPRLKDRLARARKSWAPVDDLTVLANLFGSDKGDRNFDGHTYTRVYSRLLEHLRYRPIRLLEIGLLHPHSANWDVNPETNRGRATATLAPSLQMWAAYLPAAEIFGFDVNDFSAVTLDRCQIIRGDMGSEADLARLVEETGGQFDVVIDDASHASPHQQTALAYLFEELVPGGLYIIEDLHWQPPDLERETVPTTQQILRQAELTGSFDSPLITGARRRHLEANTASISLYDSRAPGLQGRDAIAVLVKREA